VVAAASLSAYEAEERALSAQLAAAQAAYARDLAAWQAAQVALVAAERATQQAAERLDAVSRQEEAAVARLRLLAAEVARARQVVARDVAKADQGLELIYEHGTVSFLGVLFSADSFSDFLDRLTWLRRIWSLEVGYVLAAQAAERHLVALEVRQRQEVEALASLREAAAADLADLRHQEALAAEDNAQANAAVAAAAAIVQRLAAERSGLQARIRAILAELASSSTSWPDILRDIHALASQYGIDPLLVEAVVLQESGGNAKARSVAGAAGLMQLMPGTAAALGVTNVYNPIQNLRGGITYLLEMLHEFHGNLALALAAYNAGPYAVQQYGGIPPYQETQNYVRDVLSLYERAKAAARQAGSG
jgi:soluble lytic murein transglycosylase-like protein